MPSIKVIQKLSKSFSRLLEKRLLATKDRLHEATSDNLNVESAKGSSEENSKCFQLLKTSGFRSGLRRFRRDKPYLIFNKTSKINMGFKLTQIIFYIIAVFLKNEITILIMKCR